MTAQWEFKSDAQGWYWVCVDQGALVESIGRFATPGDCIADAEENGYVEPAAAGR